MNKILNVAAAVIAAFAALPAAAQNVQLSNAGDYRIAVNYADLDLATAAGQRMLEGRVEAAARRVCGAPILPSLLAEQELRTCRQSIVSAARPQLALAAKARGNGTIVLASAR